MSERNTGLYNMGFMQPSWSFFQACTGIAMVVVGNMYSDHRDCKTGASAYLFIGGIATIASNVVATMAGCARQVALRNDYISQDEKKCLSVLGVCAGIMGNMAMAPLFVVQNLQFCIHSPYQT